MIIVIVDKGNDLIVSEIQLQDLESVERALIQNADLGIIVSRRKYQVLKGPTNPGYIGTIAGLGDTIVNALCLEISNDK